MQSGWEERRKERVVKNEVAFRDYNERRRSFESEAGADDDAVPFVCECGDGDCIAAIELTPAEWRSAHDHPDQFVVIPGHERPDVESVVDRQRTFAVVRKHEPVESVLGSS